MGELNSHCLADPGLNSGGPGLRFRDPGLRFRESGVQGSRIRGPRPQNPGSDLGVSLRALDDFGTVTIYNFGWGTVTIYNLMLLLHA